MSGPGRLPLNFSKLTVLGFVVGRPETLVPQSTARNKRLD
jgi:hypothetical protein